MLVSIEIPRDQKKNQTLTAQPTLGRRSSSVANAPTTATPLSAPYPDLNSACCAPLPPLPMLTRSTSAAAAAAAAVALPAPAPPPLVIDLLGVLIGLGMGVLRLVRYESRRLPAARTKPRKGGEGLPGRLLNSGWNWTAT